MSADLTLYGTADADRTTFLYAGTTYVMTLTKDGESTSLEFELPAYMTDKIVTSVDVENNKITVMSSFKTGETGKIWADGNANDTFDWGEELDAEFSLAGKYDGNLGTLIGRTVNFQYDTDNNLTSFNLDDAEVVYGAMQYVNDTGALKDGYYKDKLTGTKYKNSVNSSSTKNVTRVFNAYDGSEVIRFEPAAGTYNYVKLVLNPDGTVSTANIIDEFPINLLVADVDGTKAIQDANNGVDLDGYIIVKDDEYIAPDELELGDIVFVNTTRKFADVYNNEVSGEIDNVISGKLDLDGKTYNWDGAQYYDDDDEEYKTLSTDDNEAAQNYLNSLDPDEETTAWLSRTGDIKYIEGTETGVVSTTDVTYLIVEAAKSYTESLKDMLKIKVFNGDETESLAIKVDDLKYYNGNAGSYTATNFAAGTNQNLAFTSDPAKDGADLAETPVGTTFPAGELMVVTYDADGKAIGLKSHQSANLTIGTATLDNTNVLGAAGSPNLSKDTTMVTTAANATAQNKFSTGSYTNLWIINEKDTSAELGGANEDDKYTLVTLTDFENEIITTENVYFETIALRADGTKATDLVVKILNDKAYKGNEKNTINGMLTGTTKKNNSDNTDQVLNTITIIGTDGEKATYYGDGSLAAVKNAKDGDYVTLTQDKVTEKITAAVKTADWQYWKSSGQAEDAATGLLLADRSYDSKKLVLANEKELTVVDGGAILQRYIEEGSIKHKVVDYSDVNTIKKGMKVWYNNTYLSSDGNKIQSDMIVVEAEDELGTPEAALVQLNSIAGQTDLVNGAVIGAVQIADEDGTLTYELWSDATGVFADTGIAIAEDGGALKLGAAWALTAGTRYYVLVETDSADYDDAISNIVTADNAELAGFSTDNTDAHIGNIAVTTSVNGVLAAGPWPDVCVITTGAGTIYAIDQFGDVIGNLSDETLTVAGDADTAVGSFTYDTDANGKVSDLKYNASTSTTHVYTYAGTANTITVTDHA